jgi:RimJ/RimL family protein N-acetyltransferase
MYKIELEGYDRVRNIFSELAEIQLNVLGVLNGNCPGSVYADDPHQPSSAYLISGDGHFLAGNTENQPFNAALNAALPRDQIYALFGNLDRWASVLDAALSATYAVRAPRWYYTLAEHRIPDWHRRVPEEYTMRPVRRSLLETGLENCDTVAEGILSCWQSLDRFEKHGFGFCLEHEGCLVSWSLADFVHGDRCEIGIHTDAGHRRQGLGTLTAAANAEYATSIGYATIGWHCWQNNAGSIGVAENVGFEIAASYEVFFNHWAAENITDMSQSEFQAFAELYEHRFEAQPPTSGFPHIVAAKAWGLSGNRQGCYRHLNRAVDLGWLQSANHLRAIWPEFFWNPNLDMIPEWQALAQRFPASA